MLNVRKKISEIHYSPRGDTWCILSAQIYRLNMPCLLVLSGVAVLKLISYITIYFSISLHIHIEGEGKRGRGRDGQTQYK